MKKFLFFTVLALVAAMTLQSCSKDDDGNDEKEVTKVYTAGFGAQMNLEGDLAPYYHPVVTVTAKNAKVNETKTGDLNDGTFEVSGYATPCTFTYSITFKKVADFDTTKEYTLSGNITAAGGSFVNDKVDTELDSKLVLGLYKMDGSKVEEAMAGHHLSGTFTVNADGTVKKGE